MKQVFLAGKGEIAVLDAPVPGRLKDSVLVRNRYSLISSGTEGAAVTRHSGIRGLYEKAVSSRDRVEQVWDMVQNQGLRQTYDAVQNKLADYNAIGYSSVGTVVEVDNDALPFRPGDTVACMGAGFANHAEYVVVPRNLVVPVPDGVAPEQASFAALACIAMQGIRRLELTPGERVGVIGLGLIGQIGMRLLAGMGYRPHGLDLSAERVDLARKVANGQAWSLNERDSVRHVMDLTGDAGLDGVMVCAASDSDEPVNLAFELCRKAGRVSIVGDVGLGLERAKMYRKELDLRMSCSYGPGRYDTEYELHGRDYPLSHVRWTEGRNLEHFLWMLQAGTIDLSELISDRFPVDEAPDAYARIKSGDPAVLGVLVDYGEPPDLPESARAARRDTRVETGVAPTAIQNRGDGPVRLGVIGVGGYVKGMHLPNLKKLENDFDVRALASRTGASAAAAARRFKVPVAASDHRTILDDPDIEAVLIATRHASHARFALEALEAGKHVFIEKPMTTDIEDAEAIVEAAERTGLVVRVGFNRRFSPYVHALRDAVGNSGLRMLYARANIGALGGDDWSNSPEEGGRLLGEGVHFYDLANWFMDGEPTSIVAGMAGPVESTNPNASVLLGYADGSHANVLYTSLGDKRAGKEYYEAFGNCRTASLLDFASLKVGGGKRHGKLRHGDKGQQECLREFSVAIRGGRHKVDGADSRAGLSATRIAMEVVARARSNP